MNWWIDEEKGWTDVWRHALKDGQRVEWINGWI